MQVTLEFRLREQGKFNTAIDQKFTLEGMRRDLVFQADNDNRIKCRFYTGKFYKDEADITGWEFYLTVKNEVSDTDGVSGATAVISKDIIDLTDPVHGKVNIALSKSDCHGLEGNYLYSLVAKQEDTKIHTLCYGMMNFIREINTRVS